MSLHTNCAQVRAVGTLELYLYQGSFLKER